MIQKSLILIKNCNKCLSNSVQIKVSQKGMVSKVLSPKERGKGRKLIQNLIPNSHPINRLFMR